MSQQGQERRGLAGEQEECVLVCATGDGRWSVWLGDDLRLLTHDDETAYRTACGIAREHPAPGPPILVSSGPQAAADARALLARRSASPMDHCAFADGLG